MASRVHFLEKCGERRPDRRSASTVPPEGRARMRIDEMLEAAGWAVQDARAVNLAPSRGVAVREFVMKRPHGRADYLLFLDGSAAGVVEAKKEGETLTGVEHQSAKYVDGLPAPAHATPTNNSSGLPSTEHLLPPGRSLVREPPRNPGWIVQTNEQSRIDGLRAVSILALFARRPAVHARHPDGTARGANQAQLTTDIADSRTRVAHASRPALPALPTLVCSGGLLFRDASSGRRLLRCSACWHAVAARS